MDNLTAKEILSAYRANGADARDPVFKESLAQCEHDPAMRTWLEDQQAFDARAASALRTLRAPEDAKRKVLATLDLDTTPVRKTRRASFRLALAAGVLFLLGFWGVMRTGGPEISFEPGEFQLASFANQTSLVHTSRRYGDLVRWLEEQGAPTPRNLPEALQSARGNGCNVYDDGRGGQISFVCLTLDGMDVHVFVFDEISAALLEQPENTWISQDGWQTFAWAANGQQQAFVVKNIPPELFRFSEQLTQRNSLGF